MLMHDYANCYAQNLRKFTDNPNQTTAEAVIQDLFFMGPLLAISLEQSFTRDNDQQAAAVLERVIKLFPMLYLNYRFRRTDEKIRVVQGGIAQSLTESQSSPAVLPTYTVTTARSFHGYYHDYDTYYAPCTPLMYAAVFNMPAMMKVILNHPGTNLTMTTTSNPTAYRLLPTFAFTCRTMLRDAAVKEFYSEAVMAGANQKDALVTKYQDYGIKPEGMRKYIFGKIMERVKAKDDAAGKIQILIAEKLSLPVLNALNSFLGDIKLQELQSNINSELEKLGQGVATKLPTVSFTDRTEESDGINTGPGDVAASSSRSVFSVFRKT